MSGNVSPPCEQSTQAQVLQQRIAALESTVEELQANITMYTQALDAVPDMVLIKGPQSRILYANKPFRDFYNMSLDELRDLIDAPFNEPDYTKQYIQDDAYVFSTGETLDIPQEPVTRHDGTVRSFHTVKSAIRDQQGKVVQTVGISRDITERNQTEAALQESDTRFRNLADHVPIVFFLHSSDGKPLYVSPAYDALWGRPHAEVFQRPEVVMEGVHPDDYSTVMERSADIQHGPVEFEHRVVRPDGSVRWVASQAIPILGPDGERQRTVSFVTDITERKQMELDLRESETRFRQMAENIGEVVWMSDLAKEQMIYISPAYERIWGQSCASLYQRPQSFVEAIHAEDRERIIAAFAKQPQGTYDEEYRIVRPDNTISCIRDRAFPIRNEHGKVYRIVGIAADITEHKQSLAEQQRLQETIIQLQAATLAELSTPLIPITDKVVVLPLIGAVDTQRAQQILTTLLEGVAERRAQMVIIDITGVPTVDTQVANTLIHAAQAVRLLGASILLTGIRPEVAHTLVNLGVDLRGIQTAGTLQSGIAKTLGR